MILKHDNINSKLIITDNKNNKNKNKNDNYLIMAITKSKIKYNGKRS